MKAIAAADQLIGRFGGSLAKREGLELANPYEEPASVLETQIARIFAEGFDVDLVGANDDFFDLGGDSLLAETLSMAISHELGRDFEVSWFLEYGTPRKIAEMFANGRAAAPVLAERPPIFAVHGRFGFMLPDPTFLKGLAEGQQFRMFELPGIKGDKEAPRRIEEIAAGYVAQLNEEYPSGPVFLAAFCTGVLIATEMAVQLEKMGRPVRQLVLIDPSIPHAVVRNYRRKAGITEERRPGAGGAASWLRKQLMHAAYLVLLGRWTDGSSDKDFADRRLRFLREQQIKFQLWFRRLKGKQRVFRRHNLSNSAQARLTVAYRHYRPHPFEGPVSILCSAERRNSFEDRTHIWSYLLPQRQVQTVVKSHLHVMKKANSSEPGRAMQAIFDAAFAAL